MRARSKIDYAFAPLPLVVMLDRELSAGEREVYSWLVAMERMFPPGKLYPGHEYIARLSRIPAKTVEQYVRKLRRRGLVDASRTGSFHGPNSYQIVPLHRVYGAQAVADSAVLPSCASLPPNPHKPRGRRKRIPQTTITSAGPDDQQSDTSTPLAPQGCDPWRTGGVTPGVPGGIASSIEEAEVPDVPPGQKVTDGGKMEEFPSLQREEERHEGTGEHDDVPSLSERVPRRTPLEVFYDAPGGMADGQASARPGGQRRHSPKSKRCEVLRALFDRLQAGNRARLGEDYIVSHFVPMSAESKACLQLESALGFDVACEVIDFAARNWPEIIKDKSFWPAEGDFPTIMQIADPRIREKLKGALARSKAKRTDHDGGAPNPGVVITPEERLQRARRAVVLGKSRPADQANPSKPNEGKV